MDDVKLTYEELQSRLSRAEAIIKALQEGEIDATILDNRQIVLIRPEEMVRRTEADLRASERRYRSLVLATTQIVWQTDAAGYMVDDIPAWQEFTGCHQEDLLGLGWLKTIHSEDQLHLQETWRLSIASQSQFELEARIRRYDGIYRDFHIRGVPIVDGENVLEEWIGTCTDITEPKLMQNMLDEERNLLLTLINNLPDYIYMKDVKSRFLLVNDALRRQLNVASKEAIIGRTDFDFAPLDLAQQYAASEQKIFETGQPLLNKREPLFDYETNTQRWVLATRVPFYDTQGQLKGLVGMSQDITELLAMKEALERERDFAEDLIETAPVIILVLDTNGCIVRFNRYMAQILGHQLDEVRGKDGVSTLVSPSEQARCRSLVKNALNNIQTVGSIVPIITKEGQLRQIEWYDKILKDSHSNTMGLLVIGQDITERQQAEREKDKLLSAVSQQREQLRALAKQLAEAQEDERKSLARELHDRIGQNLTALDLNLNLISNQISTPPYKVPDTVHTRLDDSLALVTQTAERIRDVMATLRPSVLDDYGLVAALRWYGNKFASRTGSHVKVNGDDIVPRLATIVEDTLFRIAQEALTNVAKHAKADRVWVNVDAQNGRVSMAISDNGRGFDPARQMKASKRQHWGLVTMIERTEAMGGRCQIDAHPGRGTQILIDIPR